MDLFHLKPEKKVVNISHFQISHVEETLSTDEARIRHNSVVYFEFHMLRQIGHILK